MSYDPTGPYRPPDPSYEPWQQPPQAEPSYGGPSPGPSYPPTAGYPTSGGGYPPPQPAHPQPGYQQPSYPQPGYQQPGYQQAGYPPPPAPPQRNTALIVTLIVVIVLVICGGGIAVSVVALSHSKPSANRTPVPGPVATDTGGGGGGGGGNLSTNGTIPFGASHSAQWTDKMSATVVSVVKFTPSSTAAGTHPGQSGIKVTVKISNNSAKRLDLTLASVKVKSGASGTQADTIIDLENNLGLGFEGSVPPGNAATATYGFSVPTGELSKIDVEVSPDFDHDSAVFEGAAS